jgi:hypothetical protein
MYFRWVPNQQLNEYICVPSEALGYLKDEADVAGSTEGITDRTSLRGQGRGAEGEEPAATPQGAGRGGQGAGRGGQ